jgi:branched-chain amino acid transport system substrate-binding protein
MNRFKRSMLALALAAIAGGAQAQISDNMIKIGVLTDMSSLYTDLAGAGSVVSRPAKLRLERGFD